MNYYAFGDIHGEFFKLAFLLNKLKIEDDDVLVFLGDYIDRGKMSYEVIELLIEISETYNCIFIKGNHEDMFLNYLNGVDQNGVFIYNGGMMTLQSYNKHGYNLYPGSDNPVMPFKHVQFFRNLKRYYETEEFIFVHAGIHPGTPLENMPDDILFWERSFHYMTYDGKTVVFGHTPNQKVLNEKSKICVDTGACFDSMGDLTCVKLPERTFIRQGWTKEDLDDRDL